MAQYQLDTLPATSYCSTAVNVATATAAATTAAATAATAASATATTATIISYSNYCYCC